LTEKKRYWYVVSFVYIMSAAPQKTGGATTAQKIGGVVIGIAAIVGIILLLQWCRRRKEKHDADDVADGEEVEIIVVTDSDDVAEEEPVETVVVMDSETGEPVGVAEIPVDNGNGDSIDVNGEDTAEGSPELDQPVGDELSGGAHAHGPQSKNGRLQICRAAAMPMTSCAYPGGAARQPRRDELFPGSYVAFGYDSVASECHPRNKR